MRISAAIANDPTSPLMIEDVELDEPRSDEVLVRLVASGICHTDLVLKSSMQPRQPPSVFGHEGAGVVEAVGSDVSSIAVGDHVVMSYLHCGECRQCDAGHETYCERFAALNFSGRRLDGSTTIRRRDGSPIQGSFFGQSSFATHALAYQANLVKVAGDVDLTLAAPLGCGIQTGAGSVLNVLRPGPEDSLIVLGAGGVGMAAIMAAAAAGVGTIIAVEPVAARRRVALEVGATHAIDPTSGDGLEAGIREIVRGGATHAFDTTGRGDAIAAAADALMACGTIATVGIGEPVTIDMRSFMPLGKSLRGIVEGDAVPQEFIPRLLAMQANGQLPLEKLVVKYPFADINQAINDSGDGTAIKPVIVF